MQGNASTESLEKRYRGMSPDRLLAACGILCSDCDIRKIPFDEDAAKNVIHWFKERGWLKEHEGLKEALERKMYCTGCHGDRSIHWSPDCSILECCVDRKGHNHCDECSEFPCDMLEEWSKKSDNYARALERLKEKANAV